jgi:hypothetical protein
MQALATQKPATPDSFLDRLYAKINGGLDTFGTPSPAEVAAAARRPRKSWSFEIAGTHHTLELKPRRARWEPGPRLFLDGKRIGGIRTPGGRNSRTEEQGIVDGRPVVVALEWRRDWAENLYVDLFVEGISQLDGRTLDEARASAPGPISRYDTQMWRFRRSVGGYMFIAPFAIALGAGCAAGVLLGLLVALWEVGWFGGVVLVVRRSLARVEWGAMRWVLLLGYALGYPVVSYLILWATLSPR